MNTSCQTPDSAAHPAAAPSPSPAQAARALLKSLQGQFEVFRECKPLAIGIDKQLFARLPDLDRKTLRTALRFHTQSVRYLKAMEKATVRFDLEGHPADEVTAEHRAHASEVVRERFRKDAEERKAQREAEEAERRRTEKLSQLAAKFPGRSN